MPNAVDNVPYQDEHFGNSDRDPLTNMPVCRDC